MNKEVQDKAWEVLQLMKRAKMWLEAQGYSITLKGTYTQVREVKF